MTMQIEKGHYISRIWFFYRPGGNMDVMAHLGRRLPAGPWTLDYRFRYYRDDRAHGSEDEKSGYQGTFEGQMTEEAVVERIAPVFEAMLEGLGPGFTMDVTLIQTDEPRAVIHLMSQKPYFHMKAQESPS